MKKTINENQLRKVIANKVAKLLREAEFQPTQEDWDSVMPHQSREEWERENEEMGAAFDAELAQAEQWFDSLDDDDQLEILCDEFCEEITQDAYDSDEFFNGDNGEEVAERYFENLCADDVYDYWANASEYDKIKIYRRNRKTSVNEISTSNGAAHGAELAREEEWWKSLNASNKYDVMTEAGDYDAFIDGLNEWYGYMGAEHLSPEEMEEYLDDCWDCAPQDAKMQMYQDFKDVFSNNNINENKKNMAKKTINEAMLRQIIAKNVAKVLREELEMGAPEMEDEGGIDMAAVIEQVKQHALDDRMVVSAKKEAIEAGDMDEAIEKWANATIAKGEREGHPYATTEECVEHMVGGGSYKRFFYTVARQKQEVRYGHSSQEDLSHHHGEKSRMKNSEPAGLAEAITKNVLKALKNM